MPTYRVRYRLTLPRAVHKAALVYSRDGGEAHTLEFRARTHKEACEMIHRLILPDDYRSICGRSNIALFAAGNGDSIAEEEGS